VSRWEEGEKFESQLFDVQGIRREWDIVLEGRDEILRSFGLQLFFFPRKRKADSFSELRFNVPPQTL
jgi:hypothetical protein